MPRELLQEDPQDRDRHRAPGARPAGRAVPLGVQGPRHGVLRGAPVPARRRRAHDRLERHGAHERAVRQAVRRGARDDGDAARRHVGVGALRLARRRRSARSPPRSPRVLAFSAIKNNDRVGPHHLHRRGRAASCRPRRARSTCCASISEILTFEPRSPRTDLAVGLEFLARIARRRAVAFLVSDFLATPDALRARAAHRGAAPRPRAGDASPIRWRRRCPTSGFVDLEDLETGEVVVFDTSGPESARASRADAQRAPRSARRCSAGSTWTASTCAPTGRTCRR